MSKKRTTFEMIILAIRNQPPSANGVSRSAISKYLKNEFNYGNTALLKKSLKKGVEQGKLEQNGQSFRVVGDAIPERPKEWCIEKEDLKHGNEGDGADDGDTVVVSYEGKLNDGTIFDSASKFEFILGAGDVIKGWDQGVKGMKVGGKRKLFVPSKLGYGKRGAPPEIPPNSDLHFTIKLKSIK